MTAKKQPWAVLVCRFSDDADPANVLVKTLPGLDPVALADTGTVLDLFIRFFTQQGNSTFNAVRYFNEMSHGTIDLNDSQVFVVGLGWTKAQADALATSPGGPAYESLVTQAAQKAAKEQGVQLQNFYGIVITSHYYLSMAQGGGIPGGAIVTGPIGWTGMDYRWVRNNGIQSWGQEMGHGFGLDHSRVDGNQADYMDPWDVMSTRNAYSGPDPDYHMRGPGINAWNMRCRGWLDETRVWHCPSSSFDQILELRPLHRKDLAGLLAVEMPPMNSTGGFPRYLVEYRKQENWDNGIPRSCILVHRFEGAMNQFMSTHSYLMKGTQGHADLVAGDRFAPDGMKGPVVSVSGIDDNNSTAVIRITFAPDGLIGPTPRVACTTNTNGDLHVCAIDMSNGLWHTIRKADGSWPYAFGDVQAQTRLVGPNSGIGPTPWVSCATAPNGDLHVCAIDMNNGLWHTIRKADGSWPYAFGDVQAQTRLVGPNFGIGPTPSVSCTVAPNGDLHVCAIDMNNGLWHTIRKADGSWPYAFGDVQAQTRLIGPTSGIGPTPWVSCAASPNGDLHICAIDMNNGLWHTIRKADGSWPYAFGDVQAQTRLVGPNSGIGPIRRVTCAANSNGDLHVCAIDMNNGLWHTIRKADGSWPYAFGDVQAQTRLVGPNPGIGPTPWVSCAASPNGDLHICAVDTHSVLWHTMRDADGSWRYAFGDVQAQTVGR